MILYHGSKEIVEYPEPAERWAARYGKNGYINKYEYEPNDNRKRGCIWREKMTTICFLRAA